MNVSTTTYFEVDKLIAELLSENYDKFVASERKDQRARKSIIKLSSIRKDLFDLLKDEINNHTMDYYGNIQ